MTDQRTVRGVHWRKQPCTAVLPGVTVVGDQMGRTFTCQKQQTWKGPLELPHHHRWDGRIAGKHVTVIWRDVS